MPCVRCWYVVDVAYIIKFVSSTCLLGSNSRGSFPHLAGQKPNNKVGYNSRIITNDKKAEMNEFSINFILVMMMSCFECGWLSSIWGLVDPHGWKLKEERRCFNLTNFILLMMMSCLECGWLSSIRGLVDPYGWKLEEEKMFQFDQFYLSHDDVLLRVWLTFIHLGSCWPHMDESWKRRRCFNLTNFILVMMMSCFWVLLTFIH